MNIVFATLENKIYPNKDIFLDLLRNNGFQVFSIKTKVREISKYILKQKEDASDAILNEIRKKGYSVNNLFWINLIMSSNKVSGNIIIEDLWEEDLYKNFIKLISLEKNEKFGIIYPSKVDEKSIKEWLLSIDLKDNYENSQKNQ